MNLVSENIRFMRAFPWAMASNYSGGCRRRLFLAMVATSSKTSEIRQAIIC